MSTPSQGRRTFGADAPRVPKDFSTTPPTTSTNDPSKSFLWHLLAQLEVELVAFMAFVEDDEQADLADQAGAELHRVGLLAAFRHVKQLAGAPTLPPEPLIDLEDVYAVYDTLQGFNTLGETDGDRCIRAKHQLAELMKRGVK